MRPASHIATWHVVIIVKRDFDWKDDNAAVRGWNDERFHRLAAIFDGNPSRNSEPKVGFTPRSSCEKVHVSNTLFVIGRVDTRERRNCCHCRTSTILKMLKSSHFFVNRRLCTTIIEVWLEIFLLFVIWSAVLVYCSFFTKNFLLV